MTRYIPNFLTSLNLFSGCIATVQAYEGNFRIAFFLIILAAVFDFMDGFAARLLKAYSPIGKELDSLADVISFGLAPGMMIFSFLKIALPAEYILLSYSGFIITVFSALRLAKFNVDERQTVNFMGLNTPSNAMFWGGFIGYIPAVFLSKDMYPAGIIVLVLVFSWLLVSEIPMFSLKFKSFSWKDNWQRYTVLLLGILFLLIFGMIGISYTIIGYILISLIWDKTSRIN